MAAPENLPMRPHSSDQSLQTPDTGSLLFSSSSKTTPLGITPMNNNSTSFNSLEELLSVTGIGSSENETKISNNLGRVAGGGKRPLEVDNAPEAAKKPKLEVSAGQTLPQIPSILNSSKSFPLTNHIRAGSPVTNVPIPRAGSPVTNVPIPLVNPVAISSNGQPSKSPLEGSKAMPLPVPLSPPVSAASSSVALLVQLYKHYQSTNDVQGLQRVRTQLLALHKQLSVKSTVGLQAASPSSLPGPLPSSLPGTLPSSLLSTLPTSLPGPLPSTLLSTLPSSSPGPLPTSLPGTLPSSLLSTLPSSLSSTLSSLPGTSLSSLPGTSLPEALQGSLGSVPNLLGSQISNVVSNQLNLHGSSLSAATVSASGPQTTFTGGGIGQGLIPTTSGLGIGMSVAGSSGTGLRQPAVGTTPLVGGATTAGLLLPRPAPIPLATPINNIQLLGKPPITAASSSTLKSPSIVTNSFPSSNAGSPLSLGPLQVTAQTQANVLKAVYGYRLQQIQDFIASLPIDQRPTSTQELRELLIKNNVLNKGLPNDFLAQFQNSALATSAANMDSVPVLNLSTSTVGLSTAPITALTMSSSGSADTGTSPTDSTTPDTSLPVNVSVASVASSRANAVPTCASPATPPTNNTSATPPTSSASSTLPGVTLETLKTLCRLPDADISRIPMPAMLLTLVRFLRNQKWSGSNKDLTGLLQQAQEAMTKGTLPLATPVTQSPTTTTTTTTGGGGTSHTKPSPPVTGSSAHKPPQASPLSKYMASIGVRTTLNNVAMSAHATPISVSPSIKHTQASVSRPATRYQTKTQQERIELERLNTLQKVLQSSEEARIAFRFQSHIDKLHQQLVTPDVHRPFSSWQDLILRLLPYHVFREPELPNGAMEKADAVYEGIAGVLLSKADGLMSRYQERLIREEEGGGNKGMDLVMERLWLEGERERKEEEERQKKEAEQIAAELSAVGGAMVDPMLEADPFLLDSDPYDTDFFLSQFWNDNESSTDFSLGVT